MSPAKVMVASSATPKVVADSVFVSVSEPLLLVSFSLAISLPLSYSPSNSYQGLLSFDTTVQ